MVVIMTVSFPFQSCISDLFSSDIQNMLNDQPTKYVVVKRAIQNNLNINYINSS